MQNIKYTFWTGLAFLTILWVLAEPTAFSPTTFFAFRAAMVQYSGVLAIGVMSIAMILALRPRWPERWFGGLDKMYRLHKWLGIGALILSVVHWLWSNAPKWAVGWGWLGRPQRGPRAPAANDVEALFRSLRHTAEGLGEWAFYAAVALMVLALIKFFPYRLFFKTHRLLAIVYLVLVFHSVVLMDIDYWTTPLGWVMALLMAGGTWGAVVVLFRRVGAARRVTGTVAALQYYPGVHALEIEIDVPQGWPGHKPGQFAFATSDPDEGAHPYTIASEWNPDTKRIRFIAKELGDHTSQLRDKLAIGHAIKVEGPYGCFTFDDDCPHQVWIGGGIGITPFIARMKHFAMLRDAGAAPPAQTVDLYHCTAEVDETALDKLRADAAGADINLRILVDKRDGFLTGERIRSEVPGWRDASVWFCGPAGFGEALRNDFQAQGLAVKERFHQELFSMR